MMMGTGAGSGDATTTSGNATGTMTATGQSSTQVLASMHMDYIHHVAFDVYGRRMATCSGDRFVRVWDLMDTGEWSLVGEWQAHRGSVNMLSWSHPEFGLLATCGSDHDAKLWEERPNATTPASRWIIKAQLTEARRAVSCVEFAPRHWGLKVATGSADGCVRIYEAVDVMNLAQWPLAATLQCFGEGLGVTCLSWCTGRFEPPSLVVGGSQLAIYRYSESARQWQPLMELPSSKTGGHVMDVAWAPNVGRRFHYIASAENSLRVFKLSRDQSRDQEHYKLEVESTQSLDTNAWRCQWNVTGTVLASSGDEGVVQLWKADFEGDFKCVSRIQGNLNDLRTAADS